VDKEHDRPRRLARLGRTDPLAKHPQGDIALLGPVFAAPDFAAFGWNGGRGAGGGSRGYAKTDPSDTQSPENGAARQRISGMQHASSPRHGFLWTKSNSGSDGLKEARAAPQEHHRASMPSIG
jgi:hypothetical protein